MVRTPVWKFKANHRNKALVFLNKGMSVGEVVRKLRARHHPNISLRDVRKAYFPKKGVFALANLEGASREEIIKRMKAMSASRSRMKRLQKDPVIAEKRNKAVRNASKDPAVKRKKSDAIQKLLKNPAYVKQRSAKSRKTMKRLNADPDFISKRDASARKVMKALNADPEFARKRNIKSGLRMKKFHKDLEFRGKHRDGVRKYWNSYWQRMAKLAEEMGIDGLGWDYRQKVAITKNTPETKLLLKERKMVIDNYLSSLNALERQIIELTFFSSRTKNLPVKEVALLLGKPDKTVSAKLKKALKKMAENKKLKELK